MNLSNSDYCSEVSLTLKPIHNILALLTVVDSQLIILACTHASTIIIKAMLINVFTGHA